MTYSEAPSPIYAMAEPYIEKAVEATYAIARQIHYNNMVNGG